MNNSYKNVQLKAVIIVYLTSNDLEGIYNNVLWGIEEEGVPFDVIHVKKGNSKILSHKASKESMLNVGVYLNVNTKEAVLHHSDLPEESPLKYLSSSNFNPKSLRLLGLNAARLAKIKPLKKMCLYNLL